MLRYNNHYQTFYLKEILQVYFTQAILDVNKDGKVDSKDLEFAQDKVRVLLFILLLYILGYISVIRSWRFWATRCQRAEDLLVGFTWAYVDNLHFRSLSAFYLYFWFW